MEHLTVEQVNDYVDGELTPAEREAVAQHAAECAHCQREIDAYRRVLVRLRGLPADFVPPAGLYDGILAAARQGRQLTVFARAAAVLLMAGGAAASVHLARRPAPDVPQRAASTAVVAPDPSESELTLAYIVARDSLPPQAAAALQRTVDSLDRAIDDTRSALRTYPGDGRLEERLARARQMRLRIIAD
ncbi:MAG: zf-HC2 domain-containing protein, partial [Gemmatimonadota bacterium]